MSCDKEFINVPIRITSIKLIIEGLKEQKKGFTELLNKNTSPSIEKTLTRSIEALSEHIRAIEEVKQLSPKNIKVD